MRCVYVIGVPAAGKSSLLRAILPAPMAFRVKPFAHVLYGTEGRVTAAQLGAPHPRFPGTDRLSMAVQRVAVEWLATCPAPLVIGEGDRLSTRPFLEAMALHATDAVVLWLDVPPEVAEKRCRARGSTQSDTWMRGRRTKVSRLAAALPNVTRIDGTQPPEIVASLAIAAAPALATLTVPQGNARADSG